MNRHPASRRLIAALGVAACLAGCGGNSDMPAQSVGQPLDPDPPTVPVLGVKVRPQVVQFFAIGETRQLSVEIFPTNATDQAIAWESTDTKVATVDAVGLVTAKAAGSGVFVTAYSHDGRHQASVNVSVNP